MTPPPQPMKRRFMFQNEMIRLRRLAEVVR